ncbi:MAG: aminopeptidase P N-terminal domain-containing protein [Opitutaceae bacterium]|nr:aminopeptidase P N-terminal domain-containing protein [Opitutaceae bacterium]
MTRGNPARGLPERHCPGLGKVSKLAGMNPALDSRRARVAAALPLGDALLVIDAGEPIPLPEGSDQCYSFRAHAEYYYLAGLECPGAVLTYDPRDGAAGWASFVPVVTEGERVWEGRVQPPGRPLGELAAWLAARRGRPVAQLGAATTHIAADSENSQRARAALTHARRVKDAAELDLLRRAVAATARGFSEIPGLLRPGLTERALQIEIEAEFFRGGSTRTGYHSLVGIGPHSAVLHCEPGPRPMRDGDLVLVDAGAEVDRYTADVTRTYACGQPSAFQRDLYQVVLGAQERAIARCIAGAEWKAIHLATAVDLTAGLVAMGVMHGAPESLVAQDAHTLFFPHGLGHMVGLGVRDASGLAPGRKPDPRASLRTLRMDLPLAPGYVVTVEPGLYFIPPLLNDAVRRERYRDGINWPLVEHHLQTGGVRIEDNLLITAGAPENLTAGIAKQL